MSHPGNPIHVDTSHLPTEEGDCRITLQGSALQVDGVWYLRW